MLNQDQINSLQPLTQHPKFGKLLSDAIEVWKIANPIQDDFGVVRKWCDCSKPLDIMDFDDYDDPSCCLIGAVSINKQGTFDFMEEQDFMIMLCNIYYNLSEKEVLGLIRGFDNNVKEDNHPYSQEAFDFGSQLRKIIFGE